MTQRPWWRWETPDGQWANEGVICRMNRPLPGRLLSATASPSVSLSARISRFSIKISHILHTHGWRMGFKQTPTISLNSINRSVFAVRRRVFSAVLTEPFRIIYTISVQSFRGRWLMRIFGVGQWKLCAVLQVTRNYGSASQPVWPMLRERRARKIISGVLTEFIPSIQGRRERIRAPGENVFRSPPVRADQLKIFTRYLYWCAK